MQENALEGFSSSKAELPALKIPDLTARFSAASINKTAFDWQTALSMIVASKFVYYNEQTVEATATGDWGLDTCKFIDEEETQCFVASSGDNALVTFRGTEHRRDWLLNITITSTEKVYGTVHTGFQRGFDRAQQQLEEELNRLSPSTVLITGHSLGGALATVAAAAWQGKYPISGVYTFGQPAVGRGEFQDFFETHYSGKFFRFVNDKDIVAMIPPNYGHVGNLYKFDDEGQLIQPGPFESLESGGEAEVMSEEDFEKLQETLRAEQEAEEQPFEGMFVSVSDHNIDDYIRNIEAHDA